MHRILKTLFITLILLPVWLLPVTSVAQDKGEDSLEYLTRSFPVKYLITTQDSSSVDHLNVLSERLRRSRMLTASRIAAGDGADFGYIEDIDFDSDNRLYVLDVGHFSVFNYDFEYLGSRMTRMPDEAYAVGLDIGEQDKVLIAYTDGKLDVIEDLQSGSATSREFSTGLRINDACFIGDEIHTQGWDFSDGYAVHSLDSDGELVVRYGQLFKSANTEMERDYSNGLIACLPQKKITVIASPRLPFIYVHTREGMPLWVAEIENFHSEPLDEENYSRSISPEGRFDQIVTLLPITESEVLIQIATNPRGRGDRYSPVVIPGIVIGSYILSIDTGASIFVGTSLPFVTAMNEELLFAPIFEGTLGIRVQDW